MTAVRARRMRRLLWISCALALGLPALLASCSGNENISYGTAVVTMGDASGGFSGFATYMINVDSITLTRSDGLIVEPLAQPETVDLVHVHDMNELVEAPAVPVGTYVSVAIVLDYTIPVIDVDVNGVATPANPVDPTGAAMVTTTETVTFDTNNQLVITGGECIRLHIDMSLAASNTINASASPPTVTVQPVVTATIIPADQTVMRARGIFVTATPSASSYIVNMRPFGDELSALGALTVNTSSSTYFNVNGTVYTGAAGLQAMASLQVSSPVVAYGTLGSFATITPTFNATAVYAGTAQESPLADYLTATVASVGSDTITVKGGSYLSRLGAPGYISSAPVALSSATTVTKDGVAASGLTLQSLSVGQLVNIAGQGTADSSGNLTLDATQGSIRLQPTPLWGTLNSGAAGSMSLNLLSLNNWEPSIYDFAGTGTSSANDAVATAYQINTGSLDESGTAAGTLLQSSGFVEPFGNAPPDFTAASVAVGSTLPQTLIVEWEDGGAAGPFKSMSSSGLVVDLSNGHLSSTIRYIATGPVKTDITTLPASPTIAFATGVPLLLTIGNDVGVSVYNSAASYATELGVAINGANSVYRLVCVGQYSSATNTFTATQVTINLQE